MLLRRTYRFCASHRLSRASWTEEQNLEVFGPAAHASGHGHNFRLTVAIEGEPDALTARVIDVAALDRLVDAEILQAFDHRNLNVDIPELEGEVPTGESIVLVIWNRLAPRLPSGALKEIVLHQDEFLSITYRGPA